jgi:hypothetical protein
MSLDNIGDNDRKTAAMIARFNVEYSPQYGWIEVVPVPSEDQFNFPDMLDEHKTVLMQNLVSEKSHCTAIMLACTCRRERERYKSLGYKWPFAAARISAARNGYFELFKWLFYQCHLDRWCHDASYQRGTWDAVCLTTNVELFKWYSGPGFFFNVTNLEIFSWEVFAGVFADHLDEPRFQLVLGHYCTHQWGLKPLYYLYHNRFHLANFENYVQRIIGQYGTWTDIVQLEVGSLLKNSDDILMLRMALSYRNELLLNELFENWPVLMKTWIEEGNMALYLEQSHCQTTPMTVSFLETCKRIGINYDSQSVIKKFIGATAKNPLGKLTPELRALIAYGGWTLPDNVKTIEQLLRYWQVLDGFENFTSPYDTTWLPHCVIVGAGSDSWVNSL